MMNRRELSVGGDHSNFRRKASNYFKDREEELSFFRDLQKREKDQFASLLQPVSDEFEANGNYGGFYRMDSGVRKGPALEFLAESGKNDYNWLKTPPATPLFPSLEMEATNGKEIVVQREIPIIQPLSRFAGYKEGDKTSINTSTLSNPNPKLPQRHKTPIARTNITSFFGKKNVLNPKTNQSNIGPSETIKPAFTPMAKSIIHKETQNPNFLVSDISKNIRIEQNNPTTKPKTMNRGVSPLMRPTIPGFSDERPPNLRTAPNRPASATRGRSNNQNQKQDVSAKTKRQSCSPSVARGRIPERGTTDAAQGASKVQGGNRGQVVGSRMLDRFMNARIVSAEDRMQQMKVKMNSSINNESLRCCNTEERQIGKIKLNGSLNESSGFGRFLSKNSLDVSLKHMDLQREPSNNRKHGMAPGRR